MPRKKAYVPPIQSHLPSNDYRRNVDLTFAGERTISSAYAYEHALPDETIAEARARLLEERESLQFLGNFPDLKDIVDRIAARSEFGPVTEAKAT